MVTVSPGGNNDGDLHQRSSGGFGVQPVENNTATRHREVHLERIKQLGADNATDPRLEQRPFKKFRENTTGEGQHPTDYPDRDPVYLSTELTKPGIKVLLLPQPAKALGYVRPDIGQPRPGIEEHPDRLVLNGDHDDW